MAAKHLYPDLENFVAAYFHQNWIDELTERGEPNHQQRMIDNLLKEESRQHLLDIHTDIVKLLATVEDEDSLRLIVRKEFHGNIDPVVHGFTWRSWLAHVRDRIIDHLKFSLQ